MATRHHNVTGELTKQLLAVGDGVNVTSISLTNVDSSTTTVNSVVDLYIEKQGLGRFYLLKSVNIPVGSTLILDGNDVKFSNKTGEFGLFIKLTKGTTFTLSGAINVTGANVNVPGDGSTLFLSELSVGDEVVISGETRTVAAITSNTAATVTAAFGSDLANDATPDCNPTALVDVIIN